MVTPNVTAVVDIAVMNALTPVASVVALHDGAFVHVLLNVTVHAAGVPDPRVMVPPLSSPVTTGEVPQEVKAGAMPPVQLCPAASTPNST